MNRETRRAFMKKHKMDKIDFSNMYDEFQATIKKLESHAAKQRREQLAADVERIKKEVGQ